MGKGPSIVPVLTQLGFGLWERVSLRTVGEGADKGCIFYTELPLAGTHREITLHMKLHLRAQSKFWLGN